MKSDYFWGWTVFIHLFVCLNKELIVYSVGFFTLSVPQGFFKSSEQLLSWTSMLSTFNIVVWILCFQVFKLSFILHSLLTAELVKFSSLFYLYQEGKLLALTKETACQSKRSLKNWPRENLLILLTSAIYPSLSRV